MTQTVLLALDTSTEFCSVALLSAVGDAASGAAIPDRAEPRIWVRHEQTGAVSSTRLLPAIRELFDQAGLKLADCNAIAFGSGPGSFTGLRTATGVAQGLDLSLVASVNVATLITSLQSAHSALTSALGGSGSSNPILYSALSSGIATSLSTGTTLPGTGIVTPAGPLGPASSVGTTVSVLV
jgi:tRNA threonylcarbamoyl adenosine modification protein YeaZ